MYYVVLQKYGFKVCVILFDFYSTHYKVFIYLPCIITLRRTAAPLNITHILSSRERQTPRLYQGSEDSCGGDYNINVVSMLHPSLTIHYCNQSVLTIVADRAYYFGVL